MATMPYAIDTVGPKNQASKIGEELAQRMLEDGGLKILHEVRKEFQGRIDIYKCKWFRIYIISNPQIL